MRDLRVIPVGTNLRSWVLPGGAQITAVTIDNKSGSWLLIPQDNTYIAPYTLGFAHNFSPSLLRIDILFVDGPAGQVSTLAGDPPLASIYDAPLAESAGVASQGAGFIVGFTPVQHFLALITILSIGVGVTGTLIAGIPNKRTRLLSIGITTLIYGSAGATHYDVYANSHWILTEVSSGDIVESALIGRDNMNYQSLYPEGLDIAVGSDLDYTFYDTQTHDLRAYLKATYQII